MRLPHYLIRDPSSGRFYFRLRVPRPLHAAMGLRVIKRATGTRCPREAVALASAWALRYADAFAQSRGHAVQKPPPSVADLLDAHAQGRLRDFNVKANADGSVEVSDIRPGEEQAALVMLGGLRHLPMPPTAAVTLAPASATGTTVGAALEQWLKVLPGKNQNPKTQVIKRKAVSEFVDFVGKLTRVRSLTSKTFANYYAALVAKQLAPPTIENKFIYLIGWVKWLQVSGDYPKGDNPARGHAQLTKRVKKKRSRQYGWQPFTTQQIAQIFHPANFAQLKVGADRWLPLILLYTGARANEVAHLELADLYEDDGVKVFDFNWRGEHKRLKTDASERKTPVHPDLLTLGLWERVERLRQAGETKLFPDLSFTIPNGPAAASGTAFSRYLAKLAISARGNGIVGHHSFRDTIKNKMKSYGVTAELRDAYTGHELDSRPEHREAYEDDFPPATLALACHPAMLWGVDLPGLRAVLDSPEKRRQIHRPETAIRLARARRKS